MIPWRSTFVTNGLVFISGLASGVLAARFLGVEDRGALAAVLYWPHFIAGFAAVGLNEGIAIHTARSRPSETMRSTTFAISVVLATAVGIIGWFLTPLLMGESRQGHALFAQIYLIAFLPLTYVAQNLLAIDQGELRFTRFNAQRILQAAVYPLLLTGMWAAGILTVESAAIAVLSGTAIVAVLRVWNARAGLVERPAWREAQELLRLSLPLHAVNLVIFISQQADRAILVLFFGDTELGLYTVAFTAASAAGSIVVQTYINIMLPTAARLGSSPESMHQIIVPLRRLIGILIFSTAALFSAMPYLVVLVFGGEYDAAGSYAQVLLLAFAFIGIKQVLVYLLRSWGENRPAILAGGLTASLLIAGAYLALRWWGVMGVCFAVVLAHAAGAGLLSYRFLVRASLTLKQFVTLASPAAP